MLSRILNYLRLLWINISILILSIVFLNGLLYLAIETKQFLQGRTESHVDLNAVADDHRTLSVYDDLEDAELFWDDHSHQGKTHFEPYYYWRRDAYQTTYQEASKHFAAKENIFYIATRSRDQTTL